MGAYISLLISREEQGVGGSSSSSCSIRAGHNVTLVRIHGRMPGMWFASGCLLNAAHGQVVVMKASSCAEAAHLNLPWRHNRNRSWHLVHDHGVVLETMTECPCATCTKACAWLVAGEHDVYNYCLPRINPTESA